MCFALPTGSHDQARPSRLPAPLRIALGGIVLLGILSASLLLDRLMPNRRVEHGRS